MFGRNEVAWIGLRAVGVYAGGERRWEVVSISGDCGENDDAFLAVLRNHSGPAMILAWHWTHGWIVNSLHNDAADSAEAITDRIHDGEDKHLIDLLWSELTGYQHHDDLCYIDGKDAPSPDDGIPDQVS